MRLVALAAAATMTVGLVGCDRIPFLSKEEASPPPTEAAQPADTTPQRDTVAADSVAPAEPPAEPPTQPPVAAPRRTPVQTGMDEPWTPTHSGTVNPGMSREQVVAVWGPPVAERDLSNWTYLYYRNGCEYTCGTFDVVLLQSDQVVDAIVRAPGHTYAGVSSSPPGSVGEFTPPQTGASDTG